MRASEGMDERHGSRPRRTRPLETRQSHRTRSACGRRSIAGGLALARDAAIPPLQAPCQSSPAIVAAYDGTTLGRQVVV